MCVREGHMFYRNSKPRSNDHFNVTQIGCSPQSMYGCGIGVKAINIQHIGYLTVNKCF